MALPAVEMPLVGVVTRSRRLALRRQPPRSSPLSVLPPLIPETPQLPESPPRHEPSVSDAKTTVPSVDLTRSKRKRSQEEEGDGDGGVDHNGTSTATAVPTKKRRNSETSPIPARMTRSAAKRAKLIEEASAPYDDDKMPVLPQQVSGQAPMLVDPSPPVGSSTAHGADDYAHHDRQNAPIATDPAATTSNTPSTRTTSVLTPSQHQPQTLGTTKPPVKYSANDGWYIRFRERPSSPLAPNYVRRPREQSIQHVWAQVVSRPPSLDRISLLKSRAVCVQIQTRQWFPRGFPQMRIPTTNLPPQARFCRPPLSNVPLAPEPNSAPDPFSAPNSMVYSYHQSEYTSSSSNIQLDADLEVPLTWQQQSNPTHLAQHHPIFNSDSRDWMDYSLESSPMFPMGAGLDATDWYTPSSQQEVVGPGLIQDHQQMGQFLIDPALQEQQTQTQTHHQQPQPQLPLFSDHTSQQSLFLDPALSPQPQEQAQQHQMPLFLDPALSPQQAPAQTQPHEHQRQQQPLFLDSVQLSRQAHVQVQVQAQHQLFLHLSVPQPAPSTVQPGVSATELFQGVSVC